MSSLAELKRIRTELGLAPDDGTIWLGLGFRPPKRNAIQLDPNNLPSLSDCLAIAGLDTVLLYPGQIVRYGQLRDLTDRLYRARPRRLMLVDSDHKKYAFLKQA